MRVLTPSIVDEPPSASRAETVKMVLIERGTTRRIERDSPKPTRIDVSNVVFPELSRKFLTTDQLEK
jgi:hypothetical protein